MQQIIKGRGKVTTSTPSLINDLKKNFNFTENHISSMYMHFDSSQLNNYFDQRINPDSALPGFRFSLAHGPFCF